MAARAGLLAHRAIAFWALLGLVLGGLPVTPASAQDPCEDGRNLTFNCQFDTFGPAPGGVVPQGWWPFVISGRPAFDQASDTPKPPSLRIWSDGEGFVAGIYQEIGGAVPGATYEAFIGWAVFASEGPEMGRSIGIDPRGGTDPQAASILWSPEVWEKKRGNPELRVRAVAEAEKITVFVRVDHPRSYGADQAFLDAVSLWRDEPIAVAPVPTVAPAFTETSLPPTATVVPAETLVLAETPTQAATATASATATATPTPVPPPATYTPAAATTEARLEASTTPTTAASATQRATAAGLSLAAEDRPTATRTGTATMTPEPTVSMTSTPSPPAPPVSQQAAATAWDLRSGQTTLESIATTVFPAAMTPVRRADGATSSGWPLLALAAVAVAGLAGAAGIRRILSGG